MLLSRIAVICLLLIFTQDLEGLEEENLIDDNKFIGSSQSILSNQDRSFINNSSDNNCGECQNDFHHELVNLTSNSQINITTDVKLLSFVSLVGLEDIAIIGYDNPTINCNNAGGMYFENCNNCTIIGLTWENCGTKNDSKPVIELHNSSDIIIQNCTFKHSVTQVLVFSEVSGDVTINNCKFAFNKKSVGHGMALYYIVKIHYDSKFHFTVSNCNFIQNGVSGKSVVYINSSNSKSMEQIIFTNISFINNRAVPIYVSHQNVYVNGSILFKGNMADESGGIFITNNSNVIFHNSDMIFSNNKALYNGGALHIQEISNVKFEGNCTVTIKNNQAVSGGGFYVSNNSDVKFEGISKLVINDNKAKLNGEMHDVFQNDNIVKRNITATNNEYMSDGGALYICHNSAVTFKENSVVTINNNTARYGGAIYIVDNSSTTFKGNSMVTINKNQAMEDGGAFYVGCYSNTIHGEKSIVTLYNNQAAYDGGALHITNNSNVTFIDNSMITINDSVGTRSGGGLYIWHYSEVTAKGNCTVFIENNQAKLGGAIYVGENSSVTFEGNSTATNNNNKVKRSGGAIWIGHNSKITFKGHSTVAISNNTAYDAGAIYIKDRSYVNFKGYSTVVINNNQAVRYGGGILLVKHCNVMYEENTRVTINNNQVKYGGAVYIESSSDITFKGNSTIVVDNNKATFDGGALFFWYNCNVFFEDNCIVSFTNNNARFYGGALSLWHMSNATFKEDAHVTFYNNVAKDKGGGALCCWNKSIVTIKGTSTAIFKNNKALVDGGALYINTYNFIIFQENPTITFDNNEALGDGGVLYAKSYDVITFQGNSTTIFSNNKASHYGGSIYLHHKSDMLFKGSALVTFQNNSARDNGGALYAWNYSSITIEGNSKTNLNDNKALGDGGALYMNIHNVVIFQGNSVTKLSNNIASHYGGSVYLRDGCDVLFQESTNVMFYNNSAYVNGGALYAWDNCNITIKGSSKTTCQNNIASGDGGALYINVNSAIAFQENTTVKFNENRATYFGGALHSKSNMTFENRCAIRFSHNEATQGGAIFAVSDTVFKDNSLVHFDSNKADSLGGALYISNLTFTGNTIVTFSNNEALLNGGAIYSSKSIITTKQKSTIVFTNNTAENGGAIFVSAATLLLTEYTNVTFVNNTAGQDGGAVHFNDRTNAVFKNSSTITLASNIADNHGGAVYTKITQSTKFFNLSDIYVSDNTAGVAGNCLYIDVSKLCNHSCFADRVTGNILSDKQIITSPNKIKLHYPAIPVYNDDSSECEKYYINNIMLGQVIAINPCLLDYYNKPAEVTHFKIIGESHENYYIQASEYESISCNHTIEGISILGNKPLSTFPLNYSMSFTSYATHKSISANLVVELSPCHSGFQYQSKSKKCECYNNSEIVHCSGSSSTIKRGYWFGSVTGIPTVTFCPINYCNFTCCKTTNGYYELSPVRVNQCRSHRSGTACGSCEEGYTLSFDSAECIAINKCTTVQTILIVTLTIFYWFIIIVAVFIIMYYQVGIGYFYAVTYYYSVVDILLSQYMDLSNGLYIMVTIMSSIAKVTPQFLGHLCLLENMSGIDQQFIHYVHPLAVSVILIMISWLARNSKRLSVFISKGIIRVICFLLLLSYTSMATTSLLLMRSLTLVNVDNVYTYLSPNIQYFHGRHLAYGIIAIIITLLIVIGLPLLLLLEPFLNGKINFVKIKPLLDQFQGCYKDNYRWFAAYYMICRLIIITILICNLSDTFISRYLLITATTTLALIHLLVRPYMDNILNMSDGVILQLMILVTVLPLFEYFDTYDSILVVVVMFALVILPSVQFVAIKLFTSKQTLKVITKKAIKHFSFQNKVIHKDELLVLVLLLLIKHRLVLLVYI